MSDNRDDTRQTQLARGMLVKQGSLVRVVGLDSVFKGQSVVDALPLSEVAPERSIVVRVIPALHAVAAAAREALPGLEGRCMMTGHNPEVCSFCHLRKAVAELDQAVQEGLRRHEEDLKHRGVDCLECGRRFLPLPGDYGCCSIGCRMR